jgi:hypothetical protein
MKEGL